MTHHLIGVVEIAELLSVSRQRADQLTQTKDFPAPQAELANGRIWLREDFQRWAKNDGRVTRSQTNREELDQLELVGTRLAGASFRAAYINARRASLGHGRRAGEVAPTRQAAFEVAVAAALSADPGFRAEAPPGWFHVILNTGDRHP